MSVTTRVLLDPTRMPSPTTWAREIRAQGFEADLDTEFDQRTFSGFLPCVHRGVPAGFEYFFEPDADLDDDVRAAVGMQRTLEVAFVTHSDMRELVTALIASAVLAYLADGIVWSDDSGEAYSPEDAIDLARQTEADELPVTN